MATTAWMATLPPRNEDYFDRPALAERIRLCRYRLTLLRAPCGFGKTSLLFDACRREQENGTRVFWFQCGDGFSVEILWERLAQAFALDGSPAARQEESTTRLDGEYTVGVPIGLLTAAIEASAEPCVIALDDAERVTDTNAVALINSLLQYAPPNLHLALALRSNNRGLDVASLIVSGQGMLLDTEDLRFSDPEIARFLRRPLSREEFVSVAKETEGWPLAVRLLHNQERNVPRSGDTAGEFPYRETLTRVLRARLMRDLEPCCQAFLLDIAQLDTIDLAIVEAAFPDEQGQCWEKLTASLYGLIRPIDSAGRSYRLHPLVKELLNTRRQFEDPGRFRQVNRRLAAVFAGGGGGGADCRCLVPCGPGE